MLEILFSESAASSLKLAMTHSSTIATSSAVIGVVLTDKDGGQPTKEELAAIQKKAEERHRREWESAVPIEGSPCDVYSFELGWSVGAIADDSIPAREPVLRELLGIFPRQGNDSAGDLLARAAANLQTVRARVAAGEGLRLWVGPWPDDWCGASWLLTQLVEFSPCGAIDIVELPRYVEKGGQTILQSRSWGDVSPAMWGLYLKNAQVYRLPALMWRAAAGCWRTLQQQNAPLRAVLNGQLVSAGADLYDGHIRAVLAEMPEEFNEAELIGRIISVYHLGFGDVWISLRIEEIIRRGELQVITAAPKDKPRSYHRILRKTSADKG